MHAAQRPLNLEIPTAVVSTARYIPGIGRYCPRGAHGTCTTWLMGVGRHARCVYGLIAVEIAASIVYPYIVPVTAHSGAYRMAGSHVTRDNVNLYKVINEFINELYEFMTSRPCAGVSCDIVGTRPPPARPPPPAIPQLDCLPAARP